MMNKDLDVVAASIARLHTRSFGEKSYGNYLLAPEDFRKLAGRERIEKSIFNRVADILRTEYQLLLVHASDCYAVIDESRVLRLRRVDAKALRGVARAPTGPTAQKTVFAPPAAWPFPTNSRP